VEYGFDARSIVEFSDGINMTTAHVYMGMINVSLTNGQKATLIAALNALGPASDGLPARLNHWRTRVDNNARIYEALFVKDAITIQSIKNRLGVIFDVDPGDITHSVAKQTFAVRETAIVTFTYNSTARLRIGIFGYAENGNWPTWEESRIEVIAYLAANQVAWETE
jgi:hypothetical protein